MGGVAAVMWCCGAARALPPASGQTACRQVRFEAKLEAGQSVERVFAQPGSGKAGEALKLVVQAIASGWIVRVVPASGPWGEHDRAELATPPYLSPSPLLISTDYAFRAQDAIAWNPRHFRYAASASSFDRLLQLYPRALKNDAAAESQLATLSVAQPEGEVKILDATLAAGTADQWRMAAAVASHLEETPHQQAPGVPASPLGKLVAMRVRISLQLPEGWRAASAPGVETIPCNAGPTR